MGLVQWLRGWWGCAATAGPLGPRGEQAAARFLEKLGYRILARGDRGGPGELDLVALDHEVLVFVEVKTRESDLQGEPADAVDPAKQRRLTRLAVAWMKRHRCLERKARFDVVAVVWPAGAARPEIRHFKNAFDAVGRDEFYS